MRGGEFSFAGKCPASSEDDAEHPRAQIQSPRARRIRSAPRTV